MLSASLSACIGSCGTFSIFLAVFCVRDYIYIINIGDIIGKP